LSALANAVQFVPRSPVLSALGGLATLLACASELFDEVDSRVPGHAHDAADLLRFRLNLARSAVRELVGEIKSPGRQVPQVIACPEGSPGGPVGFSLPLRPAVPRFAADPPMPRPQPSPGPPMPPVPRPPSAVPLLEGGGA
jgi:hypothetical protein